MDTTHRVSNVCGIFAIIAGSGANAPLKTLLTERAILVPAMAVGMAAFGWGIVEPLLPDHLGRFGAMPAAVGMLFTIATIAHGLSAPVGRHDGH